MMLSETTRQREPDVTREDFLISSSSGSELRATLSRSREPQTRTGAILCPGFARGKEGEFVRTMENALFLNDSISLGLRFNFSGHDQDTFNTDLRAFTFSKAVQDFIAAAEVLRQSGADRIIVIGSSTGVQPAVLAGCEEGPKADLIIGRASVLDCFQSLLHSVPDMVLDEWKANGSFEYPVGGQMVRLGADLLSDILSWDLSEKMADLTTPVHLIHGSDDQVVPLHVVQQSVSYAPPDMIHLHILPGEGHELSNNPSSEGFRWMLQQV